MDNCCTALGEIHVTGSKVLSRDTATFKAITAASHNIQSAAIPEPAHPAAAAATGGQVTGLPGGLPIGRHDVLLGCIGVGAGAPSQDLEVAAAALAAIGADPIERDDPPARTVPLQRHDTCQHRNKPYARRSSP